MVILYSTGCPMCEMLKDKLKEKNIEFVTVSDVDSILAKGIQNVPVLEVNNELLDTRKALAWVQDYVN